MKKCGKCSTSKPLDDFRLSSKSKDGRQSWCRKCFAAYEKERWHNGDSVRKRRNDDRRIARQRAMLNKIKLDSGCVDCGYNKAAVALDFDHIGKKSFSVSDGIRIGLSDAKLLAEVAECQVRCANCHRIVTHERRGMV